MIKKRFIVISFLSFCVSIAYSQPDNRSYDVLLKTVSKRDSPSQALVDCPLEEGFDVNCDLDKAEKKGTSQESILNQVTLEYPVPMDTPLFPKDETIVIQEFFLNAEPAQFELSPTQSEESVLHSQLNSGNILQLEIDLGLGSQMYYGDNDWKVNNIVELFTFPSVDFYLTLWAFSKFGFGLGANAAPFKGLFQSNNHSPVYFQPDEVSYTNADSMYDSQRLANQGGGYLNLFALVHADLMNILFGINPSRFFDIDANGGVGVIYGFPQFGTLYDTHEISFNFGLNNAFRITDHIHLLFNIRGALIGDGFDGESYMNENDKTHWLANHKYDAIVGATVGISFNLSKK